MVDAPAGPTIVSRSWGQRTALNEAARSEPCLRHYRIRDVAFVMAVASSRGASSGDKWPIFVPARIAGKAT